MRPNKLKDQQLITRQATFGTPGVDCSFLSLYVVRGVVKLVGLAEPKRKLFNKARKKPKRCYFH